MWRVVAAASLLAGCSDFPQARTESEIRQIAEDVADSVAADRSNPLTERIEELESQVESLESANRLQKWEIERLSTNDKHDTASIKSLFYNDCLFANRLGIPQDGHGTSPTKCEK